MKTCFADMVSTVREGSEDNSKPQPNHSVNGANVTWETIN
jgi:hypothetical protein